MQLADLIVDENLQFDLIDGEIVFHAGHAARHFFLLLSGNVHVLDRAGRKPIREYGAGDMFGLPEVLAHGDWPAMAVAHGATSLKVFPARVLYERIDNMPDAQRDFIAHIVAQAD